MRKPGLPPTHSLSRRSILCLCMALAVTLCGVVLSLLTQTRVRLPYDDVQLAAAERMSAAEQAVLDYVHEQGIAIEPDDLNETGLIGPEWTELTTSLGLLDAKRTALQPDFAALMVKYYQEAGLKSGDTVCCGMSGSFPGLCIAAVAAANEMDLNMRVIASYGASMYGATRLDLPVVRILDVAREAGAIDYELIAVSPGGDFDQGNNLLFSNSREVIFAMAEADGLLMIDQPTIPDTIRRRLELYGEDVDCFVNVGGASANMGTSPYTLTFPNGLVTDPPSIPQNDDRGLTFEYAARNVPVVHLLNVRGLAEENGLPFDPVPLTQPGETDVNYTTWQSPWYAVAALIAAAVFLYLAWKPGRKRGTRI